MTFMPESIGLPHGRRKPRSDAQNTAWLGRRVRNVFGV
jgi:hypothetical protein